MTTRKKSARALRSAATKTRSVGRRAQNKAAIRKRIVTAALSLFQTRGFDATTTKAIAHKAGTAEGTVFNYFRTKEDIALHFFEQEVDQAIASVRDSPRLRKAPLEEELHDRACPRHGFNGSGHCRQLCRISTAASISRRSKGQNQTEVHARARSAENGRRDAGLARTSYEAWPDVEFTNWRTS